MLRPNCVGAADSYRLCRDAPGQVTEECFQRTPLKFAADTQVLQHINGTKFVVPLVKTNVGTIPVGSEWARVPFPECNAKPCKSAPHECQQTHGLGDICDELAYPEPIPNTHGFGHNNNTRIEDGFHDYDIIDQVVVPADLPPGDYLLSWRWDCEQTMQIWQNCADIRVTN